MSAPVYDHGLLTDAIYWDGASKAICAALNAGDTNEAGRLLKHYADLSHAEEVALDAGPVYRSDAEAAWAEMFGDPKAAIDSLLPRLAIVPVLEVKP